MNDERSKKALETPLSADFNLERAQYYPAYDYASGSSVDRVKLVLSGEVFLEPETINDAIEAQQCRQIVDAHPYFFDAEDLPRYEAAANRCFLQACKLASSLLDQSSVDVVFSSVEQQYYSQFWTFISSANLWGKISESGLRTLLEQHPHCLRDVLQMPIAVRKYDTCLAEALPTLMPHSAELVIREFGVKGVSQTSINLPKSISQASIDEMMLSYLKDESPNLNYVDVLTKWPNSSKHKYRPSPEIIVLAKRRSNELNDEVFEIGAGITHTIEVSFSAEQIACKGAVFDESRFIYIYGREWLKRYADDETILNNFIYVFEFMSSGGLLSMPAHKHESSTLIETFTTRSFDEYPTSIAFNLRQTHALMAIYGYEQILGAEGTSIEHALEHVFNEYLRDELGVRGFSISLPAEGSSWLDKCKAIGPEIERALKAFKLYREKGEVDDAYFPYIEIKRFDDFESLISDKYAVPGPLFEQRVAVLFSDQSPLAFLQSQASKYQEFFYHINYEAVTRDDFYEAYQPIIDELVDNGFVNVGSEGVLSPTDKTRVLKMLWDDGAIGLHRGPEAIHQIIDDLASEGIVSYSSCLFTPDEAAYLNYMFNNARFSNAIALRNKYDHAAFKVDDPNAAEYRQDYYSLLLVLISITLKINDDLTSALGAPGVDEFVDWPWVDESLIDKAD